MRITRLKSADVSSGSITFTGISMVRSRSVSAAKIIPSAIRLSTLRPSLCGMTLSVSFEMSSRASSGSWFDRLNVFFKNEPKTRSLTVVLHPDVARRSPSARCHTRFRNGSDCCALECIAHDVVDVDAHAHLPRRCARPRSPVRSASSAHATAATNFVVQHRRNLVGALAADGDSADASARVEVRRARPLVAERRRRWRRPAAGRRATATLDPRPRGRSRRFVRSGSGTCGIDSAAVPHPRCQRSPPVYSSALV